jgi:subtilisin family serine protease
VTDLPPPLPAIERPAGASFLAQIDWTPARTRARPLVAVLDTGVDPSAPGLARALDRAGARSFVRDNPDPLVDAAGHGTHVASTVARVAAGTAGPGVRILPVTVAASDGTTSPVALTRGIRYATARGARIINISFGGEGYSRAEQAAIDDAVRRGALVIVAAGNTGEQGGPPEYPAAYRQVMAVAALGASGRALSISARGPHIGIAAPGERVAVPTAASPPGRTEHRTGTSMAAAVATGIAVRAWARRPAMSAQQVRALLETSARDVPPAGWDVGTGAGALSLRAVLSARIPPPEAPEPNDDTALARLQRALLPPSGRDLNTVRGRTGSWADPRDGFRVHLRSGDRLIARLTGPPRTDLDLVVWRVGTPAAERTPAFGARWIAGASLRPDSNERIAMVATRTGVHTVEVQGNVARGPAPYRLTVRRVRA